MKTRQRTVPLVLIALSLPLCTLAVQPFVASGINDEWSYYQTAKVLFLTGHVRYNGWATAMLGWQIYLSDLLFHLVGFSFTAARMGTLLVSAALALVVQRIFVRSGLCERYALLATFTLITSPLFMPLAFSYMSDIYGTFGLCLCLLLCMEAVHAEADGASLGWLCLAMVSNALTGTARQVAWVGVLVVCPSAMWLLRHRRQVVLLAAAVLLPCWGFVGWCMHWFHSQPYVPKEPNLVPGLSKQAISWVIQAFLRASLEVSVLCLPVLFLFAVALRKRQRAVLVLAGICFAVLIYLGHVRPSSPWFETRIDPLLLFPYMPNYVSIHGAADGTYLHGIQPVILTSFTRALWSGLGVSCAIACILLVLKVRPSSARNAGAELSLTRYQVNVLMLALFVSYVGMHLPRIMAGFIMYDRYLPPVLVVVLLYLSLLYQDRMPERAVWPSYVLLVIVAAYSVASTHDLFALHRARVAAIQELLDAHVEPTEIDGGVEYNTITQIDRMNYVFGPMLDETRGVVFNSAMEGPSTCIPQFQQLLPVVHPRYAISFNPAMCGGRAPFAPVLYHPWLGQHSVPLYILNVGWGVQHTQ